MFDTHSEKRAAFPHERHISVRPILQKRGRHPSNIWIFDSPKNEKRISIQGDVAFMHIVLLEGDVSVISYDVEPEPVYSVIDGETRQTKLDAIVRFRDGHEEWWEFKRSKDIGAGRQGRSKAQLSAQAQAAQVAGIKYEIKTENNLRGREILFDNWLTLCAAMTRARTCATFTEEYQLRRTLNAVRRTTFGSLLSCPDIDPALMIAAVARNLAAGTLKTDLKDSLFGLNSILEWETA